MKEVLLELQEVGYDYDSREKALESVSLVIRQGERIAVLGGNGAGKSTLFLLCNGVLSPSRGKIFCKGREIAGNKKDLFFLRKLVGIVFQEADSQIIAPTVEGEVSFGPLNLGLDKTEAARRVSDALGCMELEDFRSRPPHYLSGGEKKRVCIADVLAMEPELVLLDEPEASLDGRGRSLLEENLEMLHRRSIALLVSTHDVDFAWRWAERALIFHQGQLIADGSPQEIFSQEDLIKEAGLNTPQLFQITKLLRGQGLLKQTAGFPRTMEQLEAMLKGEVQR